LILENDMDVRVVSLPEGDDPDTFVRKRGGPEFSKLVENAVSFVDFLGEAFERQGKLKTPEGQALTVRTIVGTIAKMKDELKRNFYIKQVAQKYKLYESTLYNELEKILGRKGERSEPRTAAAPAHETAGAQPSPAGGRVSPAERDLLYAMIEGGSDIVRYVFNEIGLEDFLHPDARALATRLLAMFEEGTEVSAATVIGSVEEPALQRYVAEIVFDKYQLSTRWQANGVVLDKTDALRMAQDALKVRKKGTIEQLMLENQQGLKEASRKGEDVVGFLERHRQLLDELKEMER